MRSWIDLSGIQLKSIGEHSTAFVYVLQSTHCVRVYTSAFFNGIPEILKDPAVISRLIRTLSAVKNFVTKGNVVKCVML